MIFQATFKLLDREKVHNILFAKFLLYILASALRNSLRSVLNLSLYAMAGWILNIDDICQTEDERFQDHGVDFFFFCSHDG